MVFSIVISAASFLGCTTEQTRDPNEIDLGSGITMKFKLISSGTFIMGSPTNEPDRGDDEIQHMTTISKDFYMGIHEVTQAQYKRITGHNPSYFIPTQTKYSSGYPNTDDHPVEQVNWYEAVEFCNILSRQQGLTPVYTIDKNTIDPNNRNSNDELRWLVTPDWGANGYRLPTEAEWEYACRAGTTGMFYWGNSYDEEQIGKFAWFYRNTDPDLWTNPHAEKGGPQRVGMKTPNAFGLYDMSGNVWEWCWDWHGNYSTEPQTDPKGSDFGTLRLLRGSPWCAKCGHCLRSASRIVAIPTRLDNSGGFRVCRPRP